MSSMTRDQWLAERKKHLGGSDVAAILGLSPWRSPWQVWADKQGHTDDQEDTPQMRRGRLFEEPIAQMYAEDTGTIVQPHPDDLIIGPEEWMAASVDRLVVDAAGNTLHGLEIKTSRGYDGWGESGQTVTGLDAAGVMPPYYSTQCLWYMAVTGLSRWDMAVYFMGGDELRVYTVLRDEAVEAKLLELCRKWWQTHIVKGREPEVDGSSEAARYIVKKHPDDLLGVREPTPEEEAWAEELREVSNKAKELEARKKELSNRLGASVGDGKGLTGLGTWVRLAGRLSVDAKALQAGFPDVYQQVLKQGEPSGYFRLSARKG